MKSKILIIAAILTVIFSACQKEFSIENGGIPGGGTGTAQYSLGGGTGTCTGTVLSGIYIQGNIVTAANTVTLEVTVDSVGTWLLSTNTVSGISFSGSGTFVTTGTQTISLQANGTPTAAGVFSFIPGSGNCTFTITVLPATASGPAVFSFAGNGGACTGAAAGGTLTAGSATTGSENVVLQVTVDTIGSYLISTSDTNGITYLATGNFTTTGTQPVTLTAIGTPITAGDFTFTSTGNGATGCTFTVTVNPAAVTSGGYFYDVTINGINYTDTANVDGYAYFIGTNGMDSVIFLSGVTPIADPVPLGQTALIISKGTFYDFSTATDAQFKDFFNPGNYSYSPAGWSNGIAVEWKDENGVDWSTDRGSALQTGSTFTITNVEDDPVEFPAYSVKVSATFTCILYDDNGNSKPVTNGKYSGIFSKQ